MHQQTSRTSVVLLKFSWAPQFCGIFYGSIPRWGLSLLVLIKKITSAAFSGLQFMLVLNRQRKPKINSIKYSLLPVRVLNKASAPEGSVSGSAVPSQFTL